MSEESSIARRSRARPGRIKRTATHREVSFVEVCGASPRRRLPANCARPGAGLSGYRPCAMEDRVHSAKIDNYCQASPMPQAYPVERSRSPLEKASRQTHLRCHGLVPWSLTLAATKSLAPNSLRMPPEEFLNLMAVALSVNS